MHTSSNRWFDRSQWILPTKKDPRIPFACIHTLYVLLGCTILGFNRNPIQAGLTVLVCCALDMGLHWILRERKWLFPLSGYISGLGIAMLLNYSHNYYLLFLPVFYCIGSKYLVTFEGRHVFNPSLFGIVAALLVGNGLFSPSPPYQWGGSLAVGIFMVTLALTLFVYKINRTWLILSFLGFYTLQVLLRAYIFRWHLPPETLIFGTLSDPSFYLFTFYMITDPKTSPDTPKGQILRALAVVVVDLGFHTLQSYHTLYYALFTVSLGRWVGLHAMRLWKERGRRLGTALFWKPLTQRILVLGSLAGTGMLIYTQIIHPRVVLGQAGFRFEEVRPEESGIHSQVSSVLTEVDPRVEHVAKWLLSVGDSIAVGDYDNDGLLDLFLTNPVKRAEDRNALYRNLGQMKFERVPLPALDEINRNPRKYGLTGGAYFVDYDNSGAQSLLICGAYGRTRLLKNQLPITGRAEFVDVTDEVGLGDHCVSIAASFLDYDKDGKLDLLVGNSITPFLPDYEKPTPLTIFKLPEPEYEGDRRMFHFMHHGWHRAENGGLNLLFHNEGNGKFRKLDIAAMGMPETHWTLAIGTADFNRDGFTDLYCASDFGPDDLYLNVAGKKFMRVAGKMFGSVGKDTYKGMNVSIGDLDNRGEMDVYISNSHAPLQAEGSLLWKVHFNPDNPFVPDFRDQASTRGLLNEKRFGWGAAMGDLNLDGWLDVVQANGMVDDTPDRKFKTPQSYWYAAEKIMRSGPELHSYADRWGDLRGYELFGCQADRIYLSRGPYKNMQFVDVAPQVGVTKLGNSRGMALADFDNDGDLDLAITHQFVPMDLYRNRLHEDRPQTHHWFGLELKGDGSVLNREAVGTRVFLRFEHQGKKVQQLREVQIANGFCAQGDRRLLFGLGDYSGPVEISVEWYGGQPVVYRGLSLNQYHKLEYKPVTRLSEKVP